MVMCEGYVTGGTSLGRGSNVAMTQFIACGNAHLIRATVYTCVPGNLKKYTNSLYVRKCSSFPSAASYTRIECKRVGAVQGNGKSEDFRCVALIPIAAHWTVRTG